MKKKKILWLSNTVPEEADRGNTERVGRSRHGSSRENLG